MAQDTGPIESIKHNQYFYTAFCVKCHDTTISHYHHLQQIQQLIQLNHQMKSRLMDNFLEEKKPHPALRHKELSIN